MITNLGVVGIRKHYHLPIQRIRMSSIDFKSKNTFFQTLKKKSIFFCRESIWLKTSVSYSTKTIVLMSNDILYFRIDIYIAKVSIAITTPG